MARMTPNCDSSLIKAAPEFSYLWGIKLPQLNKRTHFPTERRWSRLCQDAPDLGVALSMKKANISFFQRQVVDPTDHFLYDVEVSSHSALPRHKETAWCLPLPPIPDESVQIVSRLELNPPSAEFLEEPRIADAPQQFPQFSR